jgi:hypothetical protein
MHCVEVCVSQVTPCTTGSVSASAHVPLAVGRLNIALRTMRTVLSYTSSLTSRRTTLRGTLLEQHCTTCTDGGARRPQFSGTRACAGVRSCWHAQCVSEQDRRSRRTFRATGLPVSRSSPAYTTAVAPSAQRGTGHTPQGQLWQARKRARLRPWVSLQASHCRGLMRDTITHC